MYAALDTGLTKTNINDFLSESDGKVETRY